MSSFWTEYSECLVLFGTGSVGQVITVFRSGLEWHMLFNWMFLWMDVLIEWDMLYCWSSGGNSVMVALRSWQVMPSACILMVLTTTLGSPIMTLWYSMTVEIDHISYNCSSGRGPMLAVPVRDGNSGSFGLPPTPGVASHPVLSAGWVWWHPYLWRLYSPPLVFLLSGTLEMVFLLQLRCWLQCCLWCSPWLWSECQIQHQQHPKIFQCEVYQTIHPLLHLLHTLGHASWGWIIEGLLCPILESSGIGQGLVSPLYPIVHARARGVSHHRWHVARAVKALKTREIGPEGIPSPSELYPWQLKRCHYESGQMLWVGPFLVRHTHHFSPSPRVSLHPEFMSL